MMRSPSNQFTPRFGVCQTPGRAQSSPPSSPGARLLARMMFFPNLQSIQRGTGSFQEAAFGTSGEGNGNCPSWCRRPFLLPAVDSTRRGTPIILEHVFKMFWRRFLFVTVWDRTQQMEKKNRMPVITELSEICMYSRLNEFSFLRKGWHQWFFSDYMFYFCLYVCMSFIWWHLY